MIDRVKNIIVKNIIVKRNLIFELTPEDGIEKKVVKTIEKMKIKVVRVKVEDGKLQIFIPKKVEREIGGK